MHLHKPHRSLYRLIVLFAIINISSVSFSQISDSTRKPSQFGAAVTITNKGISTIPNLTLGKPAAIFDLNMGGKRLTFEPQLRFALEGKPWSFLFWWRYKVVQSEKFRLNAGVHPALSFRTKTFTNEGISTQNMVVYRYLAAEISPLYIISGNLSIGTYYLYSHGVEKVLTRHTNMLALRANILNLKLSEKIYLGLYPQVYYLKMDSRNGMYLNSTLTLSKRNFPVSLSGMVNKRIKSDLIGDNDFIWNLSLKYSFMKEYISK